MKLLSISIALTLPAAFCLAQEPERRPGGGPPMMRRSPLFAALDADQDGSISAAERMAAPSKFKALDKNADGKITEDEVRPQFGPGGPGGGERRGRGPGEGGGEGRGGGGGGEFRAPEARTPDASDMVKALMQFDRDGNGALAKEEVPERMQGLFARGDANKDGVLDAAELKQMADAQAAAAQRAEGPGRGGPGGPGGFMRFDRIAVAVDTDKDGALSAEEVAKSADSLKSLDADGDGVISMEEVRPQMMGRGGREGRREDH